jgi:hypothetical protein
VASRRQYEQLNRLEGLWASTDGLVAGESTLQAISKSSLGKLKSSTVTALM